MDYSLFHCSILYFNFYLSLQDSRLVYKHYATLYFVLVFDSSENELAMLDLIQGIFNYSPLHSMLSLALNVGTDNVTCLRNRVVLNECCSFVTICLLQMYT